ncbi:hypothetical protein ACTXT7_010983 [Hymenolepis weldensis]
MSPAHIQMTNRGNYWAIGAKRLGNITSPNTHLHLCKIRFLPDKYLSKLCDKDSRCQTQTLTNTLDNGTINTLKRKTGTRERYQPYREPVCEP